MTIMPLMERGLRAASGAQLRRDGYHVALFHQEPTVNDRPGGFSWTVFGHQGFPTMTVPAGFTTLVYDRVLDPSSADGTRLVGPTPEKLPVGMDFAGRPFDEPLLIKIASAYTAATKHRMPPPEFGPLPQTGK